MAFNTTINTSLLTTYLIKKFIPALEAELQMQKFTTPAVIPEGQGKIGRFNVFSNPPGTVTPLAEGSTSGNEVTTLTTTGTDCTIAEYGEFIKVPQLQMLAAQKGSRDELSARFAYGGAVALDSLVRNKAFGTTTAFFCTAAATGGVTSGATNVTNGSAAALIGAAKLLRNVGGAAGTSSATLTSGLGSGAKGFTGIQGHNDGDFAAIVSPMFEATMVTEGTTGRMTWAQAVTNVGGPLGQEKAIRGYMGAVYGTTAYRTQNYGQTTVTSLADDNYVLAAGGLGAVAFGDMKATIVVNDLNSPYKNVDTIAWHAFFGTSLIDSTRVVRMYSNAV